MATPWRSTVLLLLLLASQAMAQAGRLKEDAKVPAEWLLLYIVKGRVEAGSYNYHKLNREGRIVLHMRSLKGDADLYVSDSTLHPTFEDYKLQSVTYGQDGLWIPASFRRPVGIGIYGHPSHQESEFEMKVYYIRTSEQRSSGEVAFVAESTKPGQKQGDESKDASVEDEFLFWILLISILKMVLLLLY